MLTSTYDVAKTVDVEPFEPTNINNLIWILDAYLTEEVDTDTPYLVKDGIKIIL
jgi:hypothetical protein